MGIKHIFISLYQKMLKQDYLKYTLADTFSVFGSGNNYKPTKY